MSFLNAHWYDSCHMQSNKIVFNEVKDNQVLLEPSYGKKWTNLLANPIFIDMLKQKMKNEKYPVS